MEELPGPLITDQQNFSLETKQEPEYVSTTTNIFSLFRAHGRNVFLLFLCVLVFFFFSAAGEEMFGVAVVTVGRHREQQNGMTASGYDGPAADLGQAVVWPQGVRVPGAARASE